jgi:tetratricopeptide (TPR) repeat protein
MKTSLLATLVLCAVLPAQDHQTQADTPVVTTLTNIRKTPDAYTNVTVQFTVQFASLGKISNPFFTRFTPSEYSNFYAWADEQPLWQRASYDDVFGNLFYPKAGTQLQEVYGLSAYDRMTVTAVVRNTFQSMPFIEVTSFSKLNDQVNSASLAHMYRGEQLMTERRWQRAIAELTLAPAGNTPATLKAAAYKNLGICHLRIGENTQALSYLEQAKSITTTTDMELDDLLANATTRPSKELDRVVGSNGLKDAERPMWEAFDTTAPTNGTTTNGTTNTTQTIQ